MSKDDKMAINVGMFAMPVHAPGKDYQQSLREDQECVILADKLGFTEFYMGEHHTSGIETVTNPLIFLATVARETKNIRLGSGVLNLPQMHPLSVASNVAMFDQLTDGRFIFGGGPGTLVTDVEALGSVPMDVRGRMVKESMAFVKQLWTSEPPIELKGEFWNITIRDKLIPEFRVGWMPKPKQQPHPPFALTMVSPNSSTAKSAGAEGWIPISANFVNKRYLRGHWDSYAEGCESAGRTPDRNDWRVARCCLVTESDSEAEDYIADPDSGLSFYYAFMRHIAEAGRGAMFMLKPDLEMPDEEATVAKIVPSQVIYGSRKTVLEKLVALRDEIGHFGTLIMTAHDWDRPTMWQSSMRMMAQDVIPKLSIHAEAKAAA